MDTKLSSIVCEKVMNLNAKNAIKPKTYFISQYNSPFYSKAWSVYSENSIQFVNLIKEFHEFMTILQVEMFKNSEYFSFSTYIYE